MQIAFTSSSSSRLQSDPNFTLKNYLTNPFDIYSRHLDVNPKLIQTTCVGRVITSSIYCLTELWIDFYNDQISSFSLGI